MLHHLVLLLRNDFARPARHLVEFGHVGPDHHGHKPRTDHRQEDGIGLPRDPVALRG
jgi:hypothetical protein